MKLNWKNMILVLALLISSQIIFADKVTQKPHSSSIIGAWEGKVTIIEPPEIPKFHTLFTFHKGGTMSETHTLFTPDHDVGLGALIATPAHGVWEKAGPHHYKANFRLLIQGAAGNPTHEGKLIGVNHIKYDIQVDGSGKNFDANWTSALIDTEGTVLIRGVGEFTGSRIEVGPLL